MAQLRNFVFTLNNPTVEDYESLMGLDYEYLIIGEEVADSGHVSFTRILRVDKP